MIKTTLDKIPCGMCVEIDSIEYTAPDKSRFLDLGIIKGTKVTPLFTSPSEDPAAYEVKGAVIAIRKKQARNINVLLSGCGNHEKQQSI